ncbi:MAG: CRISPR-associated protein Cas4 [Nitrospirota bacterium]|nr:CRISPR-associated protein Cas4 [Nitrospirota bacterium]
MTYKAMEEPIMVSALEHYSYCPRQCALIHVEHVWDENVYTMRGRDTHERVDEATSRVEAGVRVERALPIWSKRLNLTGKADVVEFHGNVPYPVEYKSGRRRRGHSEALQLCAQAVCLEEMFGVSVERGALYWHGSRERKEIALTASLKEQVEKIAEKVHRMISGNCIPPPVNDERCRDCSLRDACMPYVAGNREGNRKTVTELFECRDK